MRMIFLDTETTGLAHQSGHRVIEIGAVEMIDRKLTGNVFHEYLQPDRDIDFGAQKVHGITSAFLKDKPRFVDVAQKFCDFIQGAQVYIHNAAFDVGFMNSEFGHAKLPHTMDSLCTVTDTLQMARIKYPGQKNSLDALAKRLEVKHFDREFHGALLDTQILAEVYLRMTAGQSEIAFGAIVEEKNIPECKTPLKRGVVTEADLQRHKEFLAKISKAAKEEINW